MFTSECDMDAMGTSFREALERYVRALESGEWLFDAAKGFVRHRSEKADEFPNESYAFAQWVEKAAKPKPIAKAPKPKATPASAKPAATKSKANAKAKPKKTAKKATKKPKRK